MLHMKNIESLSSKALACQKSPVRSAKAHHASDGFSRFTALPTLSENPKNGGKHQKRHKRGTRLKKRGTHFYNTEYGK